MEKTLKEVYKDAPIKLAYHGNDRDLEVLKEVVCDMANIKADIYGQGKVIEDFQCKMAELLGKEEAVFFPSGTMAQQIALRIWCDEKDNKTVAYHPLCHLEIHEEDGLKVLHQIKSVLLGEKGRLFTLKDLEDLDEDIATVLIELPQREIGGQLPSFDKLEKMVAYCRQKGIRVHLDGARLLEVLPYYNKSAKEIGALFDSVYLSFYKGVGGIAGAVLAGSGTFCKESKTWKRRYGGDLISLYPYIVTADYYYEMRKKRFETYYEKTKWFAKLLEGCKHVEIMPKVPVSNMFHMHFDLDVETVEKVLAHVGQVTGIVMKPSVYGMDGGSWIELATGDSLVDIDERKIKEMVLYLKEIMNQN